MLSYDEFISSDEFQEEDERGQMLRLEDYGREFWGEVVKDPAYYNDPEEKRQSLRDLFDSMIPNGPVIRAELEGQDNPLERGWQGVKTGWALSHGTPEEKAAAVEEADIYQRQNPGSAEEQQLMSAYQKGADDYKKRLEAEGKSAGGFFGAVASSGEALSGAWEEIENDIMRAPDFWGKVKEAGKDLKAIGSVIAAQLPNSLPGYAGMAAGGAIGSLGGPAAPVTTRLGMFAGSTLGNMIVERPELVMEGLQKAGIKPTDREAVIKWFEENDKKVFGQTLKKSLIVSAADTIGLLTSWALIDKPFQAAQRKVLGEMASKGLVDLGSKTSIRAAKKLPEYAAGMAADTAYQASIHGINKITRNVAAAAIDPIMEMVGEGGGKWWATGELDGPGALLEGIMSLGTSGGIYAVQKGAQRVRAPFKPTEPVVPPLAAEKPIGEATVSILETETLDDAINTFSKEVNTGVEPEIPTEEFADETPDIGQAINEFRTNLRTGDQRVAERGVEESLAQAGQQLGEFAENRQSFIENEQPFETPEERVGILASSSPTDAELRGTAPGTAPPLTTRDEASLQRQGDFEAAAAEATRPSTLQETYETFANAEPTDAELREKAPGAAYTQPPVTPETLERKAEVESATAEAERPSTPAETYETFANAEPSEVEERGALPGTEYATAPVSEAELAKRADIEAARPDERQSTKAETYETLANKPETELDTKMDRQEQAKEWTGREYVDRTEEAGRQIAIEEEYEAKPEDFTASKGKPFKNEQQLRMSAKQRNVDLKGMKIVPYQGGVIAIPEIKAKDKIQTPEIKVADKIQTPPVEKRKRFIWEGEKSAVEGQEVDIAPSEAQKEAGNYKKGHVNLDGMDISIENPVGSVRSGKDADGTEWSTEMKSDYGYIKGTVGHDKDHLDVFIAPGYKGGEGTVFVVNQNDLEGNFDEHKVVLGAKNAEEAIKIYESNYEKGWPGMGSVVPMTKEQFSSWSQSQAPQKGEVSTADLQAIETPTKKPSKIPMSEEIDIDSIPDDMEVMVKEVRAATGQEIEVRDNAKKALKEHDELIEKYSLILGCLQS